MAAPGPRDARGSPRIAGPGLPLASLRHPREGSGPVPPRTWPRPGSTTCPTPRRWGAPVAGARDARAAAGAGSRSGAAATSGSSPPARSRRPAVGRRARRCSITTPTISAAPLPARRPSVRWLLARQLVGPRPDRRHVRRIPDRYGSEACASCRTAEFQTYFHARAARFAAFYSQRAGGPAARAGPLFDRLRLAVDIVRRARRPAGPRRGLWERAAVRPPGRARRPRHGIDPAAAMVALARSRRLVPRAWSRSNSGAGSTIDRGRCLRRRRGPGRLRLRRRAGRAAAAGWAAPPPMSSPRSRPRAPAPTSGKSATGPGRARARLSRPWL